MIASSRNRLGAISNSHEIKREKRKSLFFRELSQIISLIANDNAAVQKVYVTRVDFSQDSSILYVFLSTYDVFSQEVFEEALAVLKLYRPSIRKEIATRLNPRHTPEIIFLYDEIREKQDRIDSILDKVIQDLESDKK
jgi:ribosome-binding factor A